MSKIKTGLGVYFIIGMLLAVLQGAAAWDNDCGLLTAPAAMRAVTRTFLWLPDAAYQVGLDGWPLGRWLLAGRCG